MHNAYYASAGPAMGPDGQQKRQRLDLSGNIPVAPSGDSQAFQGPPQPGLTQGSQSDGQWVWHAEVANPDGGQGTWVWSPATLQATYQAARPPFQQHGWGPPHSGGALAQPGPSYGGGGPRRTLDPAAMAAIEINKRMTGARDAGAILDIVQTESDRFDTICLATAMHKLANMRGAPNLHSQIVTSPAFHKLKALMLQRKTESSCRNISNTLWSLAKMNHHPGEEFMQAYAEENSKKAGDGNSQNTANSLWAFATLGYHPGNAVLAALTETVLAKLPEFTAQNISNTLLSYAKLEYNPGPEVVTALAKETATKISTFSPQAMSNSLWALSKLEIEDHQLLEAIGAEVRKHIWEFNCQNLANTIWAFANLGINPGPDLLTDIAGAAIHRLPEFSPQNLSNTLWAFAKLETYHKELFDLGTLHALRIIHTLQPQTMANILWSFAALGVCPDPAFIQALSPQVLRQLEEFSPQNLSNTVWALATLYNFEPVKELHKPMTVELCRETYRRLTDAKLATTYSRQHLSNTIWAIATLGYDPGRKVMETLGLAQSMRVESCSGQEMANTVWGFAKLGAYCAPLMAKVATESTARIQEYTSQNLSNLAWSFAKCTYQDDDLMRAIAQRSIEIKQDLSLQHLSNLLWAYATLKFTVPAFQTVMTQEVKHRLQTDTFNLQQISNMTWSLAVLEALDEEAWDLFIEALRPDVLGMPPSEIPDEALSQVFQALMLMQVTKPDGKWDIPDELRMGGRKSWLSNTKNVTISEFHSEVSRMLSSMGINHEFEHLTEDRLFSVDIALSDEKIALEADGPHHFTANTLQPLADMYWRRTLLHARGWRVVSVPFYHWAGAEDEDRRALLRRLLAEVRAEPIPRGPDQGRTTEPEQKAGCPGLEPQAAGSAPEQQEAGRQPREAEGTS
ncbi:hypothetical protein ACKKBF_B05255 [Auxenochlorella protothecoides x Auxenochlorella symbiontica]